MLPGDRGLEIRRLTESRPRHSSMLLCALLLTNPGSLLALTLLGATKH